MAGAAASIKRLTLELGGNDAAIVLPDADPAKVASGIFGGAFLNAGQVCLAIKRVYVHSDTTGVGAVINTAKVQVGDNVVVFGLGGIGLNVIQGARLMLQPGAKVADANDRDIVRLPFIACRAQACEAGAVLTAEQLTLLLNSTEKSSVSYDLQNRKSFKLAFSMAGFKTAFEALKEKR